MQTHILIAIAAAMISQPLMGGNPIQVDPVTDDDFHQHDTSADVKAELGKLLFHDKILSGNLNISCATCHHSLSGSGDGLSLSVGEGGRGLDVTRDTGAGLESIHERVPRNAPPIFNLGAREFTRFFHDGRVEVNPMAPSGFDSPAGDDLPMGLDNALAVQAMFPVTSPTEMAGQGGENDQADAAVANLLAGPDGVWALIAEKLMLIPEYVELFKEAFPSDILEAGDIRYEHAANAIAAFEAIAWRFDNSPFDRYLRGERSALSNEARHGMFLFYGRAGCSTCHSGALQTDHEFHAIAMPQIGPGKGDNLPGYTDGHDDFGHERVSGNSDDRFKFRTPSLRKVALTGPYGHAGAFVSLEAVVRHHLDAEYSLHNYDQNHVRLPSRPDLDAIDFSVMNDEVRRNAIAAANELDPVHLDESDFQALMAFLHALTDPAALDLRNDVPSHVPSGLPIWD